MDMEDEDYGYRDDDENSYLIHQQKRALIEEVILLELEKCIHDMLLLKKIIGNNVGHTREWSLRLFRKALSNHCNKELKNEQVRTDK